MVTVDEGAEAEEGPAFSAEEEERAGRETVEVEAPAVAGTKAEVGGATRGALVEVDTAGVSEAMLAELAANPEA